MAISGLEEAQIAARFERRLDEIRAEGAAAERARIREEFLALVEDRSSEIWEVTEEPELEISERALRIAIQQLCGPCRPEEG